MNTALMLNLYTSDISIIQIDGLDGVREHFKGKGDLRGKTLRKLTDSVFLREWRPCTPGTSEIVILDAYDGSALNPVDIPISPKEFKSARAEAFSVCDTKEEKGVQIKV